MTHFVIVEFSQVVLDVVGRDFEIFAAIDVSGVPGAFQSLGVFSPVGGTSVVTVTVEADLAASTLSSAKYLMLVNGVIDGSRNSEGPDINGFGAVVPEPSTALLVLCGLVGIAGKRKRASRPRACPGTAANPSSASW